MVEDVDLERISGSHGSRFARNFRGLQSRWRTDLGILCTAVKENIVADPSARIVIPRLARVSVDLLRGKGMGRRDPETESNLRYSGATVPLLCEP